MPTEVQLESESSGKNSDAVCLRPTMILQAFVPPEDAIPVLACTAPRALQDKHGIAQNSADSIWFTEARFV